jgi:hypothetical protein
MGNLSEALLQEIALEEEQKIVSIDPGMEFLNNELLEEAEGYHPMFAQYMSIMEMLYGVICTTPRNVPIQILVTS